jgi:hypothetical protein
MGLHSRFFLSSFDAGRLPAGISRDLKKPLFMRTDKFFSTQTLLILSVVTLSLSCNRSMNHPPPAPPGGIAINLSYPENNPVYGKQIELIINEPGGAILMDSMVPVNTPIVTTLHTTQKLVDVTTVVDDSSAAVIYVTTWKAVDPTGWTTAYPNGYNILDHNTFASKAEIFYANLPAPQSPNINFSDGVNAGWSSAFTSSGPGPSPYGSLTVNYSRHAGNYAYFLYPTLKLYNFHLPVGDADTVDLSHMDTAIKVNYYRPGYSFTACNLVGDMDTNNIDRALLLYAPTFGTGFDTTAVQNFCYPPTVVEKYELRVYAHTLDKKNYISYYSYGSQVPATMPFPDSTGYALNSILPDNFSFTFLSARPSYVGTQWITASSKVNWTLFSSPDSTQLHPLTMLSSLNSRMLRQQNLSSLSYDNFGYGTADQLNYQDYFSYVCNLQRASTSRPRSEADFTRLVNPYPF